MKNILILLMVLLPFKTLLCFEEPSITDNRSYSRAEIISIEKKEISGESGIILLETIIRLRVLDGEYKDSVRTAVYASESDIPGELAYNTGDVVFIGIALNEIAEATEYVSIYDIDNTRGIIVILALFLASVIFVGRIKGLASVAALIITIALLFMILIPMTLKGYPPLPLTVLISILSVLITLPIITGLTKKTAAAVLGATSGIVLSAFLAYALSGLLHISGIITNEMLTVFYASDVNIDLQGLTLSAMIIAALGAIMDVCISIASSASEIYAIKKDIPPRQAFKSILNIGTDILGSMVNTLILAFVGSSLSMILFISMRIKPGMPFWMVLNYNPVLNEIVKSAVGSIGMFLSIPLTAYISIKIFSRGGNKNAADLNPPSEHPAA